MILFFLILIALCFIIQIDGIIYGFGSSFILTDFTKNYGTFDLISSFDGNNVVVCVDYGNIFTSSSYGITYNESLIADNFYISLASNGSNQIFVSVQEDNGGSILKSLNFGVDWINTSAPFLKWSLLAYGTEKLVASVYNMLESDGIWLSIDNGDNWYLKYNISQSWTDLTISQNDQYLIACIYDGPVYFGMIDNFQIIQSLSTFSNWISVAISSSGKYIYLLNQFDQYSENNQAGIYVSSDFGVTWIYTKFNLEFSSLVISLDGRYSAASVYNGVIYISSDFGLTWNISHSPVKSWDKMTLSSNGLYLLANAEGEGIYASFATLTSPTSLPSSIPTSVPSGQPTLIPSSYPTLGASSLSISNTAILSYYPLTSLQASVGCDIKSYTQNAITCTYFSNLGHYSDLYLTVNIIVSALDVSNNGFVTISISNVDTIIDVASNCIPSESFCLVQNYQCSYNINVTNLIENKNGGSLAIQATSSNVNNLVGSIVYCSYNGDSNVMFVIEYLLTGFLQPSSAPTFYPTIDPTTTIFNSSIEIAEAPLYVIAFFMFVYVILGVVLVRLRDTSTSMVNLTLVSVTTELMCLSSSLLTEIFYILFLINQSDPQYKLYGYIVFMARLIHVVPSLYFMIIIFGPLSYSNYYPKLLDSNQLSYNAATYGAVIFLMIIEIPLIRYLPWLTSEFAIIALGTPDLHIFSIAIYTKQLQTMISLIVQTLFLIKLNKNKESIDSLTLFLIFFHIVVTSVIFIWSVIKTFVRRRMLIEFHTGGFDKDDKVRLVSKSMTAFESNNDSNRTSRMAGQSDVQLSEIGRQSSVNKALFEAAKCAELSLSNTNFNENEGIVILRNTLEKFNTPFVYCENNNNNNNNNNNGQDNFLITAIKNLTMEIEKCKKDAEIVKMRQEKIEIILEEHTKLLDNKI